MSTPWVNSPDGSHSENAELAGKLQPRRDDPNALITIPSLLAASVAEHPDKPALGIIQAGILTWRTWFELAGDVRCVEQELLSRGIDHADRVVQLAPNSYEWILTDLAVLALGAVHVPLHMSLSAEQIAEQLDLADAKLLVVSNPKQGILGSGKVARVTHGELLSHKTIPQSEFRNPHSTDLATILFTSGTTGRARGVMLSHGNLTSNAIATAEAVGSPREEIRLCFLPLSHSYARTCDLYTWLYRGSRLVLAESRETILRDCQLVRPTAINGVPYFYQKIAHQLFASGQSNVQGSLNSLLGGEIRLCCCGGAGVAPETERVFLEQGLPLLAGYGLTEAGPVVSATNIANYSSGSVGRPLEGVEVRIADGGEILVRGPNVMQGYWRDEAATRAAFDQDWLRTGDLGELDDTGNLRIVGRCKEILVLSTGKNVSPTSVERCLWDSPLVENVCVVGEGKPMLGALIVPNPNALRSAIRAERLWVWSRKRAVTHPKVRELFRREIDRLLIGRSREEQIGPFAILDRNFEQAHGEITAKFSLRRETIVRNFSQVIADMYRSLTKG